jgi:rubrerythrin
MTFEYANFEKTITQLEANPELHARFLNTISLLEYMGARKILKSQNEDKISAQTLAHTAEEIRHAQTFKKLALKMSAGKLTSYGEEHLLCGEEAKEYFQAIDQAVHNETGADPFTNYLYTTLLIEERANQVYPIYEPILARAGYPGVLKAIIQEEDTHLKEILTSLQEQGKGKEKPSPQAQSAAGSAKAASISVDKMIELRMLEAAAFEKFISSVYSATLNLGQKVENKKTSENTTPASNGETQPGLTRGASQDSKVVTPPNLNHANVSGNAPHGKG